MLVINGVLKQIFIQTDNISNGVLIIPEGVKILDVKACANLQELQVVILPKSLEMIYKQAFYNCNNLTTVVMQQGIKKIGFEAFAQCHKLTHINIPANVKHIYPAAFRECKSLTKIDIPSTATLSNHTVFSGCLSLEKINGMNVDHFGDLTYIPFSYYTTQRFIVHVGCTPDLYLNNEKNFIYILKKLPTFNSAGEPLYIPRKNPIKPVQSLINDCLYYYDADELENEMEILTLLKLI